MFFSSLLQLLNEAISAVFLTGYITSSQSFPHPLSVEDEQKYLELFHQGNEEARNILVERNLRLVAHIAKKYNTGNVDCDDMISIGTIGLIKAITSFNPDKGIRLATYAARCIDNEILMYLQPQEIPKQVSFTNLLVQTKRAMKYLFWISWAVKMIALMTRWL